jgi:hypothetical protein
VRLEESIVTGNNILESGQPLGHLLLGGFVITTQLFQEILAVRASLHSKLDAKNQLIRFLSLHVSQLKLTYSEDGSDNEAMELLQGDFVRLGEGHVEFLARIIHATTQSLGSEVETSVSERQTIPRKVGGQNEVTVTNQEGTDFS